MKGAFAARSLDSIVSVSRISPNGAARPMSSVYSRLACVECQRSYDLQEIRYRCDCGHLLQVEHDLERMAHTWPDLKQTFEQRLGSREHPYVSGVWRYREMILPDLDPERIITCAEGNTPLYRTPLLSKLFDTEALYLKHEGENPTLSFKDRGMTAGVSWARHLGVKHVACASTGDTSAAMAAYAAQVPEMQAVVFLPRDKVSPEQLAQPICYGAKTLALDTDFDGCMKLVQQVCQSHPVYLLNSMNCIRIEGQKSIGIEACQQLGWEPPDWFVIPVGNAGNISALGKGMQEAEAARSHRSHAPYRRRSGAGGGPVLSQLPGRIPGARDGDRRTDAGERESASAIR